MATDRDFQSTTHHARMYRYHDQMARVISNALNKSGNKELQRQYDYHVARCKHHERQIDPEPSSIRDDEGR